MAKPEKDGEDPRSLITLLRELPGLFLELARGEFEQFKREMLRKLKKVSLASLLVVVALMLGTFLIGLLLLAAVYALHLVMPAWAAALTVAGAVLVVMVLLVGIAASLFKGNAPVPTETFDSLVEDAHAIKGEGKYDFD